MKLINSSVQIIQSGWTLKDIYNAIETAGRTCYKSTGTRYFRFPKDSMELVGLVSALEADKDVVVKRGADFDPYIYVSIPNTILKDYPLLSYQEEESYGVCPYYENLTAERFINTLIKNGHTAVLEHGTVYLKCPHSVAHRYQFNKFSKLGNVVNGLTGETEYYVTTNMRVIEENEWHSDLQFLCEPTQNHTIRFTARFICDRAIANEIVRHRGRYGISYAQESSRYCNYSLNKFGGELTFIKPSWEFPNDEAKEIFENALKSAESCYLDMISHGCKAQEARAVLPLATKTELVMTAFADDWLHFFELRCDSAAHPDIRILANNLKDKMYDEIYNTVT